MANLAVCSGRRVASRCIKFKNGFSNQNMFVALAVQNQLLACHNFIEETKTQEICVGSG